MPTYLNVYVPDRWRDDALFGTWRGKPFMALASSDPCRYHPSCCFADREQLSSLGLGVVQRPMRWRIGPHQRLYVSHDIADGCIQPVGRKQGLQDALGSLPHRVVAVAQAQPMTRQSCSAQQGAQPLAIP